MKKFETLRELVINCPCSKFTTARRLRTGKLQIFNLCRDGEVTDNGLDYIILKKLSNFQVMASKLSDYLIPT